MINIVNYSKMEVIGNFQYRIPQELLNAVEYSDVMSGHVYSDGSNTYRIMPLYADISKPFTDCTLGLSIGVEVPEEYVYETELYGEEEEPYDFEEQDV